MKRWSASQSVSVEQSSCAQSVDSNDRNGSSGPSRDERQSDYLSSQSATPGLGERQDSNLCVWNSPVVSDVTSISHSQSPYMTEKREDGTQVHFHPLDSAVIPSNGDVIIGSNLATAGVALLFNRSQPKRKSIGMLL